MKESKKGIQKFGYIWGINGNMTTSSKTPRNKKCGGT